MLLYYNFFSFDGDPIFIFQLALKKFLRDDMYFKLWYFNIKMYFG